MISAHRKSKNGAPDSTLCASFIAAAFVCSVLFGFTRDPMSRTSTLSWIGYDYPISLAVWCLLTGSAFFINLLRLYKTQGGSRAGLVSLYTSVFAAPAVVFINDWGWEATAHLVATAVFVLLNSVALIGYFAHHRRRGAIYPVTAVILSVVMASCLIIHAAVLKNGMTELVPIWVGLASLFAANFTGLYTPRGQRPVYEKNADFCKKRFLLALLLGCFGAHDFYDKNETRGAAHLLLTYVGVMICVCRVIGIGNINDMSGEEGWLCVTAGASVLSGSLAWALKDAFDIRFSRRQDCR